jgi:hypothetical protein
MKKHLLSFGISLAFSIGAHPVFAGSLLYNSIPDPLPPNVPSLGYQATQTAEFGDLIQFDPGTSRGLWSVTALMSDWAVASTYGSTDPGWYHPITLNLYNVDSSSGTPQPGSLIASVTQTFFIPWRPEASPGCGSGWRASDGNCYGGMAFEVTFDLNNLLVPDQLIYGIAFNTNTWGSQPLGTPGPYESLNFGLSTTAPTIGSRPLPDTAYWNTQAASNYTDNGAGGVGTFRQDTNWTPYSGAVTFATPEPGSITLMVCGLTLLLAGWRRMDRKPLPVTARSR